MIGFIEQNITLSRRERERKYKRYEILNSAIKLFAERGFEGTKLDDIAHAAEIGKGTIYNFFSSKEDIYISLFDNITNEYMEFLQCIEKKHNSLESFITELTEEILNYFKANRHALMLLFRLRIEADTTSKIKISQVAQKYIREGDKIFSRKVKQAIVKKEIKEINPKLFIILYRSMIISFFHSLIILKKSNQLELKESVDLIITTLFRGLELN